MEYTKEEALRMIEISSTQAKEKVELAETLSVLEKNRHFKKLFLEYYLDKYCRRLVELRANPSMQDDGNQKFIDNQLTAMGHLAQFMNFIEQEGNQAKRLLAQNAEELDYIQNSANEEE